MCDKNNVRCCGLYNLYIMYINNHTLFYSCYLLKWLCTSLWFWWSWYISVIYIQIYNWRLVVSNPPAGRKCQRRVDHIKCALRTGYHLSWLCTSWWLWWSWHVSTIYMQICNWRFVVLIPPIGRKCQRRADHMSDVTSRVCKYVADVSSPWFFRPVGIVVIQSNCIVFFEFVI